MTEVERLRAELRLLRVEAERAREDVEVANERLAYALQEVAWLRRRVPETGAAAAAPGGSRERVRDPLVRLFEVLRP